MPVEIPYDGQFDGLPGAASYRLNRPAELLARILKCLSIRHWHVDRHHQNRAFGEPYDRRREVGRLNGDLFRLRLFVNLEYAPDSLSPLPAYS